MGKHPINADLPLAPDREPTARPPRRRRRRPVPGALKAVAGLVAVALVFLFAAILGGGSPQPPDRSGGLPVAGGEPTGSPEATAPLATNNTTRIEGGEPSELAANVALTVFPARTAAQRPTAVTLVSESWREAIASAALMAPPTRAPLLVSGEDETPEATSEALEALRPARATRAPRASTAGAAAQAAEIARLLEKASGEPPEHIVIASETEPAFAAPAAAWAARSGDPVLYAAANRLPAATARLLKRHSRLPVYVLGPTSAISAKVVREIAAIDKRVRRVAGATPAENAIALARYADGAFGWNVNDPGHGFVVARSDHPLEAALAAPLSASGTWGPLLLTERADKLPQAVRQYFLDVKPGYTTDPTRAFYNHVWIIGDEGEIDVNQQAEINELAELAKVGGER